MTPSSIATSLRLHPDRGSGAPRNDRFMTYNPGSEVLRLVFQRLPRQCHLRLPPRPEPERVQGSEGSCGGHRHARGFDRGGVLVPLPLFCRVACVCLLPLPLWMLAQALVFTA